MSHIDRHQFFFFTKNGKKLYKIQRTKKSCMARQQTLHDQATNVRCRKKNFCCMTMQQNQFLYRDKIQVVKKFLSKLQNYATNIIATHQWNIFTFI